MSIIRALYVSRPQVEELSSSDFDLLLTSILTSSRANNQRNGITGALLASHLCFVQVVEGPSDAVAHIMNRIAQDERHGEIVRFPNVSVERRLFGSWSMYFGRLDQIDRAMARAFAENGRLDPFRLDGERLLAFLYACAIEPSSTATTLRLDRLLSAVPSSIKTH